MQQRALKSFLGFSRYCLILSHSIANKNASAAIHKNQIDIVLNAIPIALNLGKHIYTVPHTKLFANMHADSE